MTTSGTQSLSVAPVAEGEAGAGRRVLEGFGDRTYRVDHQADGGPVDRRVEGGLILTCEQQHVILRVRLGKRAGYHISASVRSMVFRAQGTRRRAGLHAARVGGSVALALTQDI